MCRRYELEGCERLSKNMDQKCNMRIFAILQEPANYTLDIIKNIYNPRGVQIGFINPTSAASDTHAESKVSARFLFQIFKSYDAVVVNGYTSWVCLLSIWLNILFFKKPMAIDSDTELRIPENKLKRTSKWLWLRFLFTRKYCYGFAGGNYGHKDLFRYYGMAEERIFLMPMMVDNSRYSQTNVKSSQKMFVFGYLGRLVPLKQIDKIIKALPQGCELDIIGDGYERAMLETLAKGKEIRFHGSMFGDDKIRLLHSFDCLILYSSYEQWGLVINEALASGIPVIVSDRVGARKDLIEGENPTGLVAKWDDVNDLSKKMMLLASDFSLYAKLSANARKRMEYWNYDLYGKNFDLWIRKIGGGPYA